MGATLSPTRGRGNRVNPDVSIGVIWLEFRGEEERFAVGELRVCLSPAAAGRVREQRDDEPLNSPNYGVCSPVLVPPFSAKRWRNYHITNKIEPALGAGFPVPTTAALYMTILVVAAVLRFWNLGGGDMVTDEVTFDNLACRTLC